VTVSYSGNTGSVTSAPTAPVDINRTFTVTTENFPPSYVTLKDITLIDGHALTEGMEDMEESGVRAKPQDVFDEMRRDANVYNVLVRGVAFVVKENDSLSDYYVVADERALHIEYDYALNPYADWIRDMLMNGIYGWKPKEWKKNNPRDSLSR
jgi:hypothetical protein